MMEPKNSKKTAHRLYLTWYGTASICIETENEELITDPFVPLRGSKVPVQTEDFDGHDTVLITHGHIDHIGSLPELYQREKRRIFCSRTPMKTLISMGIPEEDIRLIRASESFRICDTGEIKVTAYRGRHVKFDFKLILKTLFHPHMLIYASNILPFIRLNRICKEARETLHYLIEAEGKRLFLLGSSALAEGVEYPKHCNLVVLPFSGRSDIAEAEMELVERLEPEAVLIDHFDDSFPPVSSQVDTEKFFLAMKKRGIPVIRPVYKEKIPL